MKEEIKRIAEAYQKTVLERIDQLLEMDAKMYHRETFIRTLRHLEYA